jgi:phosphoglycolate phosphatase
VLEHFAILSYFAWVGGSSLDGTINNKYEVIGSVLPHLSPAERAACVMVGDRETDIRAAHEHGLPTIAAGYGYGSPEELATCGPQCIVASVAELQAVLCGSAAASGERHG